jgi:phospholipid/cholesterol/gamma-HCH transport system substrate-binding protein
VAEQQNYGASGPTDAELASAVPPSVGAHEFRVGAFVILGILAVVTILFLMTNPATFRGRYLIMTRVEDAGGIRRGDPVQMKGVPIGRIHRFDIAGDGVDITLEIEGEWDIPSDSQARLLSSGLLGGTTVDVLRGTATTYLSDGSMIPGASGGGGLMDTAENLGGKAETVLGQIETLLSDPTVASIQSSAAEMQTLLRSLSELTRTQGSEIAQLTATLNEAAEGVSGVGPTAQATLEEARATMAQLNTTSATLDQAVGSLDQILGRMSRGEGSLGRLSQDDELYVNLSAAAESARALMADIREHPGRYIKISVF